jgi:hypothetical protein
MLIDQDMNASDFDCRWTKFLKGLLLMKDEAFGMTCTFRKRSDISQEFNSRTKTNFNGKDCFFH